MRFIAIAAGLVPGPVWESVLLLLPALPVEDRRGRGIVDEGDEDFPFGIGVGSTSAVHVRHHTWFGLTIQRARTAASAAARVERISLGTAKVSATYTTTARS